MWWGEGNIFGEHDLGFKSVDHEDICNMSQINIYTNKTD